MYTLPADLRTQFESEIRNRWAEVRQDEKLIELYGGDPDEAPDVGEVIDALLRLLHEDLKRQLDISRNLESDEVVLTIEGENIALVNFKGEETEHTVSGLTRITGIFGDGTNLYKLKPVWISHPFWQCRLILT